MPLYLDVLDAGWKPPYWEDPNFLQALSSPTLEHINDYSADSEDRFIKNNLYFIGQYLASERVRLYRTSFILRRTQMYFRSRSPLRAAMLIPPDWQAPPIPEELTAEKSEFVAAAGIVFDFVKAISGEVRNLGGSDDDLRKVVSQPHICRRIAEFIMDSNK